MTKKKKKQLLSRFQREHILMALVGATDGVQFVTELEREVVYAHYRLPRVPDGEEDYGEAKVHLDGEYRYTSCEITEKDADRYLIQLFRSQMTVWEGLRRELDEK